MLMDGYKYRKHEISQVPLSSLQGQTWKPRTYPVPKPTRRGFRWKASVLRGLQPWIGGAVPSKPVTVMVPALYNILPAETLAMGWLNEIDALVSIRQRISCAAKISGWDVFTFHTLHNLDPFFSSTIAAVRDTWLKEGNLSLEAVSETRRKFSKPFQYHYIPARLIENLVFQSSLLDWISRRSSDVPLRFHFIGTALVSGLVSCGSMNFGAAVRSVLKFGARWDETVSGLSETSNEDERDFSRFKEIRNLIEGHSSISLSVPREDLPQVNAPVAPFLYSPTTLEEPVEIVTAKDAERALETLNLNSWATVISKETAESVRGWLASPLHPVARGCRWSMSNYLLATPESASLFLDHIATLGRPPMIQISTESAQNRLRLSRMKVTGP